MSFFDVSVDCDKKKEKTFEEAKRTSVNILFFSIIFLQELELSV